MTVEEQDELIRDSVKIEKTANDATVAHKQSFPMLGKLICVAEERLNELKSDRNADGTPKKRQIAVNTSLANYWEGLTRTGKTGAKLNPHGYSCAVAFGTYFRSDLITEADYDKNTAQCLELAASISTAVSGDVSHEAVLEAADELKDRSKDSAKNLRAILETVKEVKALSADRAKTMLAQIIAAGFMNTLVIPAIGSEIAHVTDSETARSSFFALDLANQMFATNTDEKGVRRFDDNVLDGWLATIQEREAAALREKQTGSPVKVENAGATETQPTQTPPVPDAKPGKNKPAVPAEPVAAAA